LLKWLSKNWTTDSTPETNPMGALATLESQLMLMTKPEPAPLVELSVPPPVLVDPPPLPPPPAALIVLSTPKPSPAPPMNARIGPPGGGADGASCNDCPSCGHKTALR